MGHQKRLSAPKHYPIQRKENTYVSSIKGSRSKEDAVPAVLVLRDILEYAETEKEAKKIVKQGDLLRNGERIRDIQEGIGVLDTVEISETEEAYRVVREGKYLKFVPVEEADKFAVKIVDKKAENDEYVYSLHSGENYRTGDEFSTNNTLVFDGDSVEDEVELEGGTRVLVIGGQHSGDIAELKEINERGMEGKTGLVENGEEFETPLENLVAVGDLNVGENE